MTASTPSMGLANVQAAWALWDALTQGTKRHVVLSPGARNAPLVLAAQAHPEVQLHVVLDERAAGFVALGLAMATGRAAIVLCTSGSAGGHYLPAVMEAFHSQVPLVALTADRPEAWQHLGHAQTTRQDGLLGNHVRAVRQLASPRSHEPDKTAIIASWRVHGMQMMALAENAATGPGPVHLNACFAEPLVPSPEALNGAGGWAALMAGPSPRQILAAGPQVPSPQSYDALIQFFSRHPSGVVVCGPLGASTHGPAQTSAIVALARALGWPILADPLSGLRFQDAAVDDVVVHRYDQLIARGHTPPAAGAFLCVGDGPTSKGLNQWLQAQPGPRACLGPHAKPQPLHSMANLLFYGDVAQTCWHLHERLTSQGHGAAPKSHMHAWQAWQHSRSEDESDGQQPLTAAQVWPAVLGALPPGTHLHVGSSMAIRDLDRFGGTLPLRLTVTSSRGLNGIDGTIATASGLALAQRAPTLCVMGELTFLHDVGALQNTRGLRAGGTLVVLNNNGGQIFAQLPIAKHGNVFERYFRTPQEANIGLLSQACGCSHELVTSAHELARAIDQSVPRAQQHPVHVIEARITASPGA